MGSFSFQDYFVLLPAAFYEATILEKRVETPCLGDSTGPSLCRHFDYPTMAFETAGPNKFHVSEDKYPPQDFYTNSEVCISNSKQKVLTF